MAQTRREFLVNTGCGALSASALLSGLGRFALIDALAQSNGPAGYRALVCVFLFGGNDSNNVVIPLTHYEDYSAQRVVGRDEFAIPLEQLLPINPPTHANQGTFGLHPQLGNATGVTTPTLYDLWSQPNPAVAIVCNTGPLIQPISRDDYIRNISRPYQLFSHSDQQNLWQTSYANRPKQTGWGGTTVDRTGGSGGNFPAVASIAGVTVFSTGQNTRPLVLSPAPTPLNASLKLFKPGGHSEDEIREVLMTDGSAAMAALIRGATTIATNALDASDSLAVDPTIDTPFPNTSLGNQLLQVAKLIKIAPDLAPPVSRQVFFCSLGGFDTHTNQGGPNQNRGQWSLLLQVSQAIGAFYAAMGELNRTQDVTLFTSSDFSRTFKPGGGNSGTDHAWGSHQFVVGGAVNGGDFYGQYPPLVLGDGQDTDGGANPKGRWIPTTSVDQYAATLATWYGLSPSDRSVVFPNIEHFPNQTLGFMMGQGPARGTAKPKRG